MFYHGFFFLLFFSFRRLISELAERNSTKIGHMLGSKCNLKTHVQNLGFHSLTNWVPKTTCFGRIRNLTATLSAYIFEMKHDIDSRASALTNTKGSTPTSAQNNMNFDLQTASNWTAILPTLRKFCILFHCLALQTEISKRNSTKLCQTVDGKSR